MTIRGVYVLLLMLAFPGDPSTSAQSISRSHSRLTNPAMSDPNAFAWQVFLQINHPAKVKPLRRGYADRRKRIGAEGCVVWETWRAAGRGQEVFLSDGSKPPAWNNVAPHSARLCAKELTFSRKLLGGAGEQGIATLPECPGSHCKQEVRMNEATYRYIVENVLYNVEGQEAIFKQAVTDPSARIDFPPTSQEVKAEWKELGASDQPGRYHTATINDKLHGLVALHVTTKDVPNWFWATFLHRDSAGTISRKPGMPESLKGTRWENYLLVGVQTDYTDSIGRPLRVSNPVIELGREDSSCMSCHARATIGPRTVNYANRLNLGCSGEGACVKGVPDPTLFGASPALLFLQLDFVWSLDEAACRTCSGQGRTSGPVLNK